MISFPPESAVLDYQPSGSSDIAVSPFECKSLQI